MQFILNNKLIDAFYKELQLNEIKDLDVSFETKLSDSLEKVALTVQFRALGPSGPYTSAIARWLPGSCTAQVEMIAPGWRIRERGHA